MCVPQKSEPFCVLMMVFIASPIGVKLGGDLLTVGAMACDLHQLHTHQPIQ